MKSNLLLALVAVLALLGGVSLHALLAWQNDSVAEIGQLAFEFPDVDGRPQNVAQWRGKVLVINFWATWCPPCLKEIPEFVEWQREYQARNVQFVGIAVEDSLPVAKYLNSQAVNYPILVAGDAGSELARQLGNLFNAVPFTVVVDSQGRIVYRQPGEMSKEQFLQAVQPLLGEMGGISAK